MRVVLPPVIVDGIICRVIAPLPSLLEVQEWREGFWMPSDILLSTAAKSSPAPAELLVASGIPFRERTPWPRAGGGEFTEESLIARARRSRSVNR